MKMPAKFISPILMWVIVLVGFFLIVHFTEHRFVFRQNAVSTTFLFFAVIYWLYFFLGALRVHRRAPLSVDKIDKLITGGVYGKVRHPIYAADILLGWAIFFFYPDVRLLLAAHLMMFVMIFWIRLEEQAMIAKFGDVYLQYKERVPKLFPKVWRK
jgi:protein-S-isoprenylcysteine O-methyltransferase Ste14